MIVTWGQGGGLNAGLSFALQLSDAGAGAVTLAPLTAGGSPTAAFTRATTAWTKLSTGLWASVASGTARSGYLGANTAAGAYGGYFAEPAATNLCLQARDLTNASWTKVTMTAALDQTGIDGAANSASSLTATAGAATCLQTITEAATASAFSMFIKRITGTGTVTIQQGASTSEISGSINSSTYTRVEIDATVLNPAIGISLGTNGDKIAVDMVQFENTAGIATSPIPTTTVAVTRNADVLSFPAAGNIVGTVGTCYAEVTCPAVSAAVVTQQYIGVTGGGSPLYEKQIGTALSLFDGTAERIGNAITASGVPQKFASMWSGAACKTYIAGVASPSLGFDGDLNVGANLFIGCSAANVAQTQGFIKNVRTWTVALTDGQIASQ